MPDPVPTENHSVADALRLLDLLPLAVLVIDENRRVVHANPAVVSLLKDGRVPTLLGARPGDVYGCRHSAETPDGCGGTESCTLCGTHQALQAGQRGARAARECRIVSAVPGADLDLRVVAQPWGVGHDRWTLCTLVDITDEKRRESLERLFFHDALNSAGGIYGLARLFEGATDAERLELGETVECLAGRLIDDLKTQQTLSQMHGGDLPVVAEQLDAVAVLDDVAETYNRHPVANDRRLCIEIGTAESSLISDGSLLRRVLGNLTKNALEACAAGGLVTLRADGDADRIEFSVHNSTAMPREVQLQVFQRSFSTKGPGRGLGTYSARLLSERYLKGAVSFRSSDAAGTTFVASYPRRF